MIASSWAGIGVCDTVRQWRLGPDNILVSLDPVLKLKLLRGMCSVEQCGQSSVDCNRSDSIVGVCLSSPLTPGHDEAPTVCVVPPGVRS